jgi:excisionase family DNA binding protein
MDELIVNQTKYISSKRAAEITGYAKDYIGQLVRKGKLDAKRVGRAWYVSESEIKAHAGIQEDHKQAIEDKAKSLRPTSQRVVPVLPQTVEYVLPKTWGDIKYFNDEAEVYPISDKQDSKIVDEIANKINVSSGGGERVKIRVNRDIKTMSDVVVPKPISIVSTKTETRRGTVDSAGHAASSRQRLLRAFNYFFLTLALIFVLLSIPIIL